VGSEIEALREELAALRHALDDLRDHMPDAFIEGELQSERVTFMNRIACQVFRCAPAEVAGLHARDIFAPDDYQRAQQDMREMLARGYAEGGGRYSRSGGQDLREYLMRRLDGTTFPAETQSSLILDRSGRAIGVRSMVRDISARKQMEARLDEASVRDPLTGCYNRRYLDRKRAELEAPDAHWACLLFDLTDFKAINDTWGHDEGDRVLQAFAHFLARHHRSEDILVRLGGDEFALFIRAGSEGEGQAIAKRVVDAAARDSPAAFSLGTAVKRPDEKVSSLLTRADQVLYASKGRSLRPRRRQPGAVGGTAPEAGAGAGGTTGAHGPREGQE
jgi:diguanylate cyclase (GGDEF)-like protein/PAS domain S-box-containing protein